MSQCRAIVFNAWAGKLLGLHIMAFPLGHIAAPVPQFCKRCLLLLLRCAAASLLT